MEPQGPQGLINYPQGAQGLNKKNGNLKNLVCKFLFYSGAPGGDPGRILLQLGPRSPIQIPFYLIPCWGVLRTLQTPLN